jgi:chromosome partitioning protein
MHYKLQAVSQLLGCPPERVRALIESSGIEVGFQAKGPRIRQFSMENVFDLAAFRQSSRAEHRIQRKGLITVYAPKGGVGKTTLTANLGCLFALMGLKTLLIDLDFQANLTLALGYDSELTLEEAQSIGVPSERVVQAHLGHLYPGWPSGRVPLSEALKKPYGPNGPHLIPSDLTLDRLDTLLTYDAIEGKKADIRIPALIQEGLSGQNPQFDLSSYDVILFDAAPAKNRMTKGALLASDVVLAPVSLERYSTKAISYLSSVLHDMSNDMDRSPELVLAGNFHVPNRLRVYSQISALSKAYPGALLETMINRSEELPKMLSEEALAPPIVLSKPSASVCEGLRSLALALLLRMGVLEK